MQLPRFRLRTLMIAVAVVAVWLAVFSLSRPRGRNRFFVLNRSGVLISQLTVSTRGGTLDFRNVPNAAAVSGSFRTRLSDEFVFEGSLADGGRITGHFGVRTENPDVQHPCLIVRPGGKTAITRLDAGQRFPQ